jgi:hypothetical protein
VIISRFGKRHEVRGIYESEIMLRYPAGFMAEAGRHEIPGHALAVLSRFPHARFRPFLKFQHGLPDRPFMQSKDAVILQKPDH